MQETKKKPRKLWKKILIIFSVAIISIMTLVIIFISPITKYVIEKYDVKYSGREITLDWAYVNPFTGYVHFSNLKIFEEKSEKLFFSLNGLSTNFSMLKLFQKTYEISAVTLDHPIGVVVMKNKKFNFSDLIEKFTPKQKPDSTKEPVHLNVLNVEIKNGEFFYKDLETPVNYSIKKFDFESSGIHWDVDSATGKFSFIVGQGSGELKGDFMMNIKSKDYRIATVIRKLDLKLIEQYLKDLATYGTLSAFVDADLEARGNMSEKQNICLKGKLEVTKFHFGKNKKDDYASFDKLRIGIKELAPKDKKYFFDTVMLEHPYFKYERYDSLDNIQRMFGHNGAKVKAVKGDPEKFNLILEIGKYVKVLFKNFLKSDYKLNNLDINKGDIHYNDYAISEKFGVSLNPFSIKADSIDNNKNWVKVNLESGIKPYGSLNFVVSMNPKDNRDFNLIYKIQKIPLPVLNPYLITYTSFPLDRGIFNMNGNWQVRNDIIESKNHIVLVDIRTADRIKKKDTKWIPMRLIMAFVREPGNVIDYEIPVTGNLKNPKFKIADAIVDLIENIVFKPPTTPHRIKVNNTENEVEKSLSISWGMRQTKLLKTQEKFVEKIADFLEDNPEAILTIKPYQYTEKEKEYILLFEAKKKYYFSLAKRKENSITDKDSITIDKMSIKDNLFIRYLNQYVKDSMIFTVQDKCSYLVSNQVVNSKLNQLQKRRQQLFLSYFKKNETEKQIKFSSLEDTVPYNGFSTFKINYNGEVPEKLLSAYQKLNEINNESPRNKYLKFRKNKI